MQLAIAEAEQAKILKDRLAELAGQDISEQLHTPALSMGLYPPLAKLAEWVSDMYGDNRIYLHPNALKGAQQSTYERPDEIFKCMRVLGDPYWLSKKYGQLAAQDRLTFDFTKAALAQNISFGRSLSGGESGKFRQDYEVSVPWRSDRLFLDSHLGRGNSHDPRHCLRVYFTWDKDKELVVVGSLPRHLQNRLT